MGQTLVVPNVCRKGARGAGLAKQVADITFPVVHEDFCHPVEEPELRETLGGVWQPLLPNLAIRLQPTAGNLHGRTAVNLLSQ